MCSLCPIRNENHISYVTRNDYHMVFVVKAMETMWDGKEAYLISVEKQAELPEVSENEKSLKRMSKALQNSINVYTEINLESLKYKQINLNDSNFFTVAPEGDYIPAYEHMCNDEIHPDDVEEVRRIMSPENIRKVGLNPNGPAELSVRYRLKNADSICLMQSRAIFIRDELPHYVVSLATDVTHETMLGEQSAVLTNIFRNIVMGIMVFEFKDNDVEIVIANPAVCEMMGIDIEKVIGIKNEGIFQNVHLDDVSIIENVMKLLKKSDQKIDYEYRTWNKELGSYVWLSCKGRSIPQKNGNVAAYICYNDITEEKRLKNIQMELEIEKTANQAKSYFLSNMSHDIRTPMNAILNMAKFTREDINADKKMKL